MRNHIPVKHVNCKLTHCHICDGGLLECAVCGSGEGALPTECPGVKMTGEQMEKVQAGKLDFVNGRWTTRT